MLGRACLWVCGPPWLLAQKRSKSQAGLESATALQGLLPQLGAHVCWSLAIATCQHFSIVLWTAPHLLPGASQTSAGAKGTDRCWLLAFAASP